MPFDIKQEREAIEQTYIGFSPNTTSVKPVHLANGLFRTLLGVRFNTRHLLRFVFTNKSDGSVPKGHELLTIYDWLVDKGRIDEQEVVPEQLARLRSALRKIVSADNAVYTEDMDSYSAGSNLFLSNDRIAQDGGEFLALWLQHAAPNFIEVLRAALEQHNDPITLIAKPVLSDEPLPFSERLKRGNIRCLGGACPPQLHASMQASAITAENLAKHLALHPNKLVRLRMALLLGAFLLIRHLADLEHGYNLPTSHSRPVFLLDFSEHDRHPVRLASRWSYVMLGQSLTRFYGWMFGDYLSSSIDVTDLEHPPKYGNKERLQDKQLYAEEWKAAQQFQPGSADYFLGLGEAMYNILAVQAEATPIQYLRQLGIRQGLFWPPYNLQPTKQIAPRQDVLEVLVRGVLTPGELIDLPTILDRLWESYRIVIGGRPEDLDVLVDAGIYQADSQALEENQAAFAQRLQDLSFARLLADGVFEVQVGATAWI